MVRKISVGLVTNVSFARHKQREAMHADERSSPSPEAGHAAENSAKQADLASGLGVPPTSWTFLLLLVLAVAVLNFLTKTPS